MNNIHIFAIVSVLAASVFLVGANSQVFAQDNMTMNTSESAPMDNTTQLTDTGAGLDANIALGNTSGANATS
jgi:hypothetical protein